MLHEAWPVAVFLLWACWFSAWQCGAFAMRKLGFRAHASRKIRVVAA